MHPYKFGLENFEHTSLPTSNLVLFHDKVKLEDSEELEKGMATTTFWQASEQEGGRYRLEAEIIDGDLSDFLIMTGQLAPTGKTVMGRQIYYGSEAGDLRDTNLGWPFQNENYNLYSYGSNIYVNTNLELAPIVLDSENTNAPNANPREKDEDVFALPNLLDAMALQPFNYYLFISGDGFKINDAFENTQPQTDDDIIFYLESKDGVDAFGSVARIKSGKNARRVTDFSPKALSYVLKRFDLNVGTQIRDIVESHLKNGDERDDGMATLVFDRIAGGLNNLSTVRNFPYLVLEKLFRGISDDLLQEYLIAGENRWRYYLEDGRANPQYAGMFPKSMLDAMGTDREESFSFESGKMVGGVVTAFAKAESLLNALPQEGKLSFIKPYTGYLGKVLQSMRKTVENIAENLDGILSEVEGFGREVLIFANAYYVGLWNSIVEILRGILDLLALLMQLSQQPDDIEGSDFAAIGLKIEMSVEMMENLLEWIESLFTVETVSQIFLFYVNTYFTISNAITQVYKDRVGYLLGFAVGLIVEELLDALLTGGIKNVADVGRYLTKSVDEVLDTVQRAGDWAVARGQRQLDRAAMSAAQLARVANALIRQLSDPAGLKKFLDLLTQKFREFITGVKIDLIVAGQRRVGTVTYSNIPVEDFVTILGRAIKRSELNRLDDLGVKVLETDIKGTYAIVGKPFERVKDLLLEKNEVADFISDLRKLDLDDAIKREDFIEKYSKLHRSKPRYFKSYTFKDMLDGKKPCFLAGTLVHTIHGAKPIEEIKTGETVWCYDTENGKLDQKQVTQTYRNRTQKYRVIKTEGGDEIKATGQHLFYVKSSNTWIKTYQLKTGMHLYDARQDQLVRITNLKLVEEEVPTYNLEVEDLHNYLVGSTGLLSHNANKTKHANSFKEISVLFYELKNQRPFDRNQTVRYVGQTVQKLRTRFAQHQLQGEKALISGSKRDQLRFGFKTKVEISALTDYQNMSQFDADVIEQYYINSNGGRRRGLDPDAVFMNVQNAISKRRFNYVKSNSDFNPCKYDFI
ncbi:MAG: Hint domain-containing protein [Nonlabens sp.]